MLFGESLREFVAPLRRDVAESVFVLLVELDPIADRWSQFPPVLFIFEAEQGWERKPPEHRAHADDLLLIAGLVDHQRVEDEAIGIVRLSVSFEPSIKMWTRCGHFSFHSVMPGRNPCGFSAVTMD